MTVPTLSGIESQTLVTDRLTTRVLFAGPEDGEPVLFLHGNLSSATWWEDTMLALPPGYRGIAPDLRGYGDADPAASVDATRGLGDFVDDTTSLLDDLAIDSAHVVGNSLGGVIVWWLIAEMPHRLGTVTVADPGSPFGFGATRDTDGNPTTPDYAGSGAGLVNPELVSRAAAGDRSMDSPFSPRAALRAAVWKPPFVPDREEDLLSSLLSTHWGVDGYPGDVVPSEHWPHFAPGTKGANNALSPKYSGDVVERLLTASPKPPILWIRGADDLAVSDAAAGDPGTWGPLGLLPGYPGREAFPPQPMVSQIRGVLDRYAAVGGYTDELVMEDCAHVPFIEQPDEFNRAFHAHLVNASK